MAESMPEVEVPESVAQAAAEHDFPMESSRRVWGSASTRLYRALHPFRDDSVCRPRAFHELQAPRRHPTPDHGLGQGAHRPRAQDKPGPKGLRLADVEVGAYGFVPDRWPYNGLPRGAYPPCRTASSPATPSMTRPRSGPNRPASCTKTPSPTAGLGHRHLVVYDGPLPDHIEQSICQLMTHWSEGRIVGWR